DKYKMMHSEWLVDFPCDMTTKWSMLLCPEGKHVLVIATHGKTKIMNKARQEVGSFHSVLPGGGPDNPQELTVLDCIWIVRQKTLYVLDMLCWAHHDVVACEAEFRFFWLLCKFNENPDMTDRKSNQGFRFVCLESNLCEPAAIEAAMSRFPPFPDGTKLDGVLFYHMEAIYQMGTTTPLVGWLKGYMIPDVLGLPVAPQYLESKPPGLTLQENIKEEEQLMDKQRQKNRKVKVHAKKEPRDILGARPMYKIGLVGIKSGVTHTTLRRDSTLVREGRGVFLRAGWLTEASGGWTAVGSSCVRVVQRFLLLSAMECESTDANAEVTEAAMEQSAEEIVDQAAEFEVDHPAEAMVEQTAVSGAEHSVEVTLEKPAEVMAEETVKTVASACSEANGSPLTWNTLTWRNL
ncbi:hypothetical protein PR048_025990, partial [Dryococelus australis]